MEKVTVGDRLVVELRHLDALLEALRRRGYRSSTSARYRQWMTHTLATWHDQFGSSGCVGCGRCITWCPAGIDMTEEVRALREAERA